MIIRGDLEILRDLVIKTAALDPQLGKMLTATSTTGKVAWRDLAIIQALDRTTHNRGALVTDGTFKVLYIANSNGAPGNDLTHSRWSLIGGSGGGAGGGVVTVATYGDLISPGTPDIIYVTEDTNSLYRWDLAGSVYVSIVGIQDTITSSIEVGGIKKNIPVTAGTDLAGFINQLINPEILATLINPYLSYTVGLNLSNREMIGSVHTLNYTNTYNPGLIQGYDYFGDSLTMNQKGGATFVNTPDDNTQYTIIESNTFSGKATYTGGIGTIYSSTGVLDTSIDRTEGSFSLKTIQVAGYYNVYMGVTNKTRSQVVADLTAGAVPQESHIYPYTAGEDFLANGDKLASGNVSLFLLLPKGKFDKSRLVTISNDVPIQTYDLANFGGVDVTDVSFAHGNTNLMYTLYFRADFGGWTSDMEIKEFKINNL